MMPAVTPVSPSPLYFVRLNGNVTFAEQSLLQVEDAGRRIGEMR